MEKTPSSDIKVFKNADLHSHHLIESPLYAKSVFKMLILDQSGTLVSGICVTTLGLAELDTENMN